MVQQALAEAGRATRTEDWSTAFDRYLDAARGFYGELLGCPEGRSAGRASRAKVMPARL